MTPEQWEQEISVQCGRIAVHLAGWYGTDVNEAEALLYQAATGDLEAVDRLADMLGLERPKRLRLVTP